MRRTWSLSTAQRLPSGIAFCEGRSRASNVNVPDSARSALPSNPRPRCASWVKAVAGWRMPSPKSAESSSPPKRSREPSACWSWSAVSSRAASSDTPSPSSACDESTNSGLPLRKWIHSVRSTSPSVSRPVCSPAAMRP
ncbi:hypothetical protein COSO111634_35425 [Corallococcus soli]